MTATDASPDMPDLARSALGPDTADRARRPCPATRCRPGRGDPVGHVLSYLPDMAAIEAELVAAADALRPGGVLAVDILDLDYGGFRAGERPFAKAEADWAIITEFSGPPRTVPSVTPRRSSRRGGAPGGAVDERHENVLRRTRPVCQIRLACARRAGVRRDVARSGTRELPPGPLFR